MPVSVISQVWQYEYSLFTKDAVQLAVAELDAQFNKSGTSGSDFDGDRQGSEMEDDSDTEGEPEDEEGEKRKKKRSKKIKKGALTRDQISVAVSAIGGPMVANNR